MDEAQQAVPIAGKVTIEAVKVPLFSAGRERTGDFELSGAVFGRSGHKSWKSQATAELQVPPYLLSLPHSPLLLFVFCSYRLI